MPLNKYEVPLIIAMVAGPMTFDSVRDFYASAAAREDKRRKSDALLEFKKKKVYGRLGRLKAQGYIQSREYRSAGGRFSLFGLGDAAVGELVHVMGYCPPHQIRNKFPSQYGVSHELEVTGVVRALRSGAERGLYGLDYEDEAQLRKARHGVRNMVYPDLLMRVDYLDERRSLKIALEVDNSTITRKDIVEKIRKLFSKHQEDLIMFLCTTGERIDDLRAEVMADSLKTKVRNKVPVGKIVFGLQNDLSAHGLTRMPLYKANGDAVRF